MIIYRGKEIKQETFGDGTLKVAVPENLLDNSLNVLPLFGLGGSNDAPETITWCYDSDSELFTLRCLVDTIRDVKGPYKAIDLVLPYIPHARQDRKVSNRVFTLKSFANMLNDMNFNTVRVLDPHSDVSSALINRVTELLRPIELLNISKDAVLMYPDAGAAKKYKADDTAIIGNKHRNSEGRIEKYELLNFVEGTKAVVIVDDICSYGGTFVAAAEELRRRGVETVGLIVSHCEDNISKGKVFDTIDFVYTSDSICHLPESEKLKYIVNYNFRKIITDTSNVDNSLLKDLPGNQLCSTVEESNA